MQCNPVVDCLVVTSAPVDVIVPFSVPAILCTSAEPVFRVVTDQLFVQLLKLRVLTLPFAVAPEPWASTFPSSDPLHSIVTPRPEVSWRMAWPSEDPLSVPV